MSAAKRFCLGMTIISLCLMQCALWPFGKKEQAKSPWKPKAKLSAPRALLAVATVHDKLYAIGGCQADNRALGLVEEYSPEKNKWMPKAPMPTPRIDLACGVIGGKIYCVGGYDPDDGNYYLNHLEAFDPVANRWEKLSPMPTRRSGLAVGVIDGKLYAVGGNCDQNWKSGCLYMVEEYNPATDRWTTREALPTPRSDLAMAVYKGKLVAIGGAIYDGGEWYYFNNTEMYDPGSNTWKNMAPMPTARCDCAVAVVGSRMYVAGGIRNVEGRKHSMSLNDVEIFHPDRNRWSKRHPLPTVRYSLALGVLKGKIYAVGGISGSDYLATVEEYNP